MEKKQSRQRVHHLRVPVLRAEADTIKHNAANCGLPVAAYMRSLALHYKPKGISDSNTVMELAKINGDLGRLGGLLKMLLTNDERLKAMGKEQGIPMINALLEDIKATQAVLFEAAREL